MNDKYKFLSVAPKTFKILAWVGLVLGIISAGIVVLGMDDSVTPRWMAIVTIIAAVIYFFIFYSLSELIQMLLNLGTGTELECFFIVLSYKC